MTVFCREFTAPLGKAVLLPHVPMRMPHSLITVSPALTRGPSEAGLTLLVQSGSCSCSPQASTDPATAVSKPRPKLGS